jgi:choline dehydrogenase
VAELRSPSPLNEAFLAAAALNGIPNIKDYNGAEQFGSFMYQVTHKNGERCSAAKGYITPNLSRPNLTVRTHATTARLLLAGKRARGVSYYEGNELKHVHARREVVLSSGAFGSPQTLMLSGIGPRPSCSGSASRWHSTWRASARTCRTTSTTCRRGARAAIPRPSASRHAAPPR